MNNNTSTLSAARRALGRAPKTKQHDAAAEKLFRGYRNIRGLPEQMSPDEVAGDNLQEYMLTAGHYFANRAVARHFNEDLEPSNPENLHALSPVLSPATWGNTFSIH